MKTLIKSIFSVVLMSIPVLCEDTLPALPNTGHVTLNWQQFHDLWTKMQSMEKQIQTLTQPENHPPLPYTLTKAAYQGVVEPKRMLMQGVFDIDVYEPKQWVKVPFLPSSIAIQEARLDGEPIGLVEDNGSHQVVLRKAGRHTLRVRFSLKSPKDEEAPQLSFATPNTPVTYLALEFPKPHLEVTVEPSEGVQLETQGRKTLLTASIPPTSQIALHWQKALPEEAAGPSKLYVNLETLFTVSEAALRGSWTLHYTILHRGTRELRIAVPEIWNILSVNAEGLQEWKSIDSKEGKVLAIQLAYAKKGDLEVTVQTEKSLSEKETLAEIPRLRPVGIEREQGSMGLEARGTVELQVKESKGLNAIDPQELPRTIWNGASQPLLFAFRYTQPYSLVVGVTRHPEVPVLTTTVDEANAVTLLTARGQMMTRIRYQVRNNLKQYLALQLPRGSQLWSAFVSNQPVKPTRLENGAYRIPLAKSQLEVQGQQGFPVEIVYYTPTGPFLPVGYKAALFPVPDAPVSRVLWSLYIPTRYRVAHFGGDMEEGEISQAVHSIAGLADVERTELEEGKVGGLLAFKEKFGRKLRRALRRSDGAVSKNAALMDRMVTRQMEMASEAMAPAEATAAGVYPVAFEIPSQGQLFSFTQVMIVDKSPSLSIFYVHHWIIRCLLGLLFAGLAALLYIYRKAACNSLSKPHCL